MLFLVKYNIEARAVGPGKLTPDMQKIVTVATFFYKLKKQCVALSKKKSTTIRVVFVIHLTSAMIYLN